MNLGEKLAHLRQVEGELRGLDRPLSKAEVSRTMRAELGVTLSAAYLSQIEAGKRRHLTATSRERLARFFKVLPGFLVDDPPGVGPPSTGAVFDADQRLRAWLEAGAADQARDPDLAAALRRLAEADDPRRHLHLLGVILAVPGMADELAKTLARR